MRTQRKEEALKKTEEMQMLSEKNTLNFAKIAHFIIEVLRSDFPNKHLFLQRILDSCKDDALKEQIKKRKLNESEFDLLDKKERHQYIYFINKAQLNAYGITALIERCNDISTFEVGLISSTKFKEDEDFLNAYQQEWRTVKMESDILFKILLKSNDALESLDELGKILHGKTSLSKKFKRFLSYPIEIEAYEDKNLARIIEILLEYSYYQIMLENILFHIKSGKANISIN